MGTAFYEMVESGAVVEGNVRLRRIRALRKNQFAEEGTLGGFIEDEANLTQSFYSWVGDEARVSSGVWVSDGAHVHGRALCRGELTLTDCAVGGNALIDIRPGTSLDINNLSVEIGGSAYIQGPQDLGIIKGLFGSWYDETLWHRPKDGGVYVVSRSIGHLFSGSLDMFLATVEDFQKAGPGTEHFVAMLRAKFSGR